MKKALLLILATAALISCNENSPMESLPASICRGEAQGTTYKVTIVGDTLNRQMAIDSILDRLDQDLSLWVENSLINRVNAFDRTDTVFAFHDTLGIFSLLYDVSSEIYRKTEGAFDPTVYPLVNAWGFGLENRKEMNQEKVDSLLEFVGFEPFRIDLNEFEQNYVYQYSEIRKGRMQTQLDFNAIAQGYSVDIICDYLNEEGLENYMVELGGEVKCKGFNPNAEIWRIAVDKPVEGAERTFQAILNVKDKAVATSGNYRKFYEKDGVKYSHTIDPRTGYPVQHSLLSATVMANDCGIADAYATAFMVMGVEKTAEFIAANPDLGLDVYLLYDDGEAIQPVISQGMRSLISELEQ